MTLIVYANESLYTDDVHFKLTGRDDMEYIVSHRKKQFLSDDKRLVVAVTGSVPSERLLRKRIIPFLDNLIKDYLEHDGIGTIKITPDEITGYFGVTEESSGCTYLVMTTEVVVAVTSKGICEIEPKAMVSYGAGDYTFNMAMVITKGQVCAAYKLVAEYMSQVGHCTDVTHRKDLAPYLIQPPIELTTNTTTPSVDDYSLGA